MASILVDTHQLVLTLKTHGFSDEQASGVAEAVSEIDLEHVTTKQDLALMKEELHKEISIFKADLFKWLVPILLGQAALTAALVQLFSR